MATSSEQEQGPSRPGRGWPHWVQELDELLPVRPQFVISGNIRDDYLTPRPDGPVIQPGVVPCIWEKLALRGFAFLLIYDPVDGIRVFPDNQNARDAASQLPDVGVRLNESGSASVELENLLDWLRAVVGVPRLSTSKDDREKARKNVGKVPCALVIDYASRLVNRPQELEDRERRFFSVCEKLAHSTQWLRSPDRGGPPPFNPVVWLINRPNDLPDWFVVGNEAIRTLVAALPDRETRADAAAVLARDLPNFDQKPEHDRDKLVHQFADLTDGLTLRAMQGITELARNRNLQIADAVRRYKVGVSDNPWKQSNLSTELRGGEAKVQMRVKGQDLAVRRALDILIRSVMGLSGAQASARGARPRGVLFFAGPTGVGKTELAKAITQLIFGDEQAYRRFDMSEFSAEHSDARLIGAPPGYVGYDAGGELVNAIRERPFSVVLFDEVEKAHPRILDKFLQILEDGRLTDGRGETVFFSEAIIVFTSNLGMFVEKETLIADEHGRQAIVRRRVPVFAPETAEKLPSYDELEQKIRKAIADHFRDKLERPELLNRIGDNIVVFDFIRPPVAEQIFEMMLKNVKERMREEHELALDISDSARQTLLEWCTQDLTFGGRGIGNRLETTFINPLACALFEEPPEGRCSFTVRRILAEGGKYSVELT